MEIRDRFIALKDKKDKLEKMKMEYEVRLETLKEQIKKDLKELYTKYNVSSLEEAKIKYKDTEKALIQELEEMEKQLEVYENSVKDIDI